MATEIIDAVRNQDTDKIKSITSNKAILNTLDEDGRTPFLVAAAEGKTDSLKALLSCGSDQSAVDLGGRNAFLIACAEGHTTIADFLLSLDPKFMESRTKSGNTGLHRAAAYGQPDVVLLLCQRGAVLEARNAEGQTALHRASRWGHEEATNVMLECGADPFSRDTSGKTPLDWASDKGHADVVAAIESFVRSTGMDKPVTEAPAAPLPVAMEEENMEGTAYIDGIGAAGAMQEADAQELYELGTPMHVEGWMAKQGHFIKNWKNRWFVLDGRSMAYYAKEGAKQPKGIINMISGTDVIIEEKYQKPFCFTIITPTKKFVLQAADEDEMAEWIEAIQNNLECCPATNVVAGIADDDD